MNFDRQTTAPCIIIPPMPDDPRCLSADFALANPTLCAVFPSLILKPSVGFLCSMGSIAFKVFEYQNGIETEVTSGLTFQSSNNLVFLVGVNGGSGTGLSQGTATITVTKDGRTAMANITVLGENCCDDIRTVTSIVLDNSRSSSLNFGGSYSTRLNFAKAVATMFGGNIIKVDGEPKDADKVWSFSETIVSILSSFTGIVADIVAAIAGVGQTLNKTDLLPVFETAANDLLNEDADKRVLLLISDGEQSLNTDRQSVIDAATLFKTTGGVVICVGLRASGQGYDLLERVATPGFFLNATAATADDVLAELAYIKSLQCAGNCVPAGDIYINAPQLDYSSFLEWEILEGQVNLLGYGLLDMQPGNGLYVEMCGGSPALMRTIGSLELLEGQSYRISFFVAGNQRQFVLGQSLKVFLRDVDANDSDPNIFEQVVSPAWNANFTQYSFNFTALSDVTIKLNFQQLYVGTAPTIGNLLDRVVVENTTTLDKMLVDDFNHENLVYVPPACGSSSPLPQIENPAAFDVDKIGDYGTALGLTFKYTYGISYLTNEGETAATTELYTGTVDEKENTARRVTVPQPDSIRVKSVRIWRSLGEVVGVDATATTLYLLAEIPVGQETYLDTESKTQFQARYEPSVNQPTVNTTLVLDGGLGFGTDGCCGYYSYSTYETVNNTVPVMTGEFSPSGFTYGSPFSDVDHLGWKAFDDDLGTYYEATAHNGLLTYGFPVGLPKVITAYKITPVASGGYPTDWVLEGSPDNTFWATLDTRAGITFSGATPKTFDIASPNSYRFYRFLFSDSQGTNLRIARVELFNAFSSSVLIDGTACPSCIEELGLQPQDPSPLPDIESGFTPPTTFSSTKEFCALCPTGFENMIVANGVLETVAVTAAKRKLYNFSLSSAKSLSYFEIAGNFEVGATYSIRASTSSLAGTDSASNNIKTGTTSGAGFSSEDISGLAAFQYYQLSITKGNSSELTITSALMAFGSTSSQTCKTATETSLISQADADAKALASATALANAALNCKAVYTSTQSYTAVCTTGFGNPVTKSATATSNVSQADAAAAALLAAQTAAEAALDCTLSNNTERITINDRTGADPARATPYPSVKYVSGLSGLITKVVCTLKGFNHAEFNDVAILLVSPAGTKVELMRNKGGSNNPFDSREFNLVFDDAAASSVVADSATSFFLGGDNLTTTPIVINRKPTQGASGAYQSPAPAPAYLTTLAAFIGENPNGSWNLFLMDDTTLDVGYCLGGFELTITTA